jgi:hypothetical protein
VGGDGDEWIWRNWQIMQWLNGHSYSGDSGADSECYSSADYSGSLGKSEETEESEETRISERDTSQSITKLASDSS